VRPIRKSLYGDVVWFSDEEVWLFLAELSDSVERCSEAQGLELLGKVVGRQPVPDMTAEIVDRA
jgi:hypothetical protein